MNRQLTAAASGVYLTPGDPGRVQAQAEAAGAKWRRIDLSDVRDKAGLLERIADVLEFPPHFGANWDALADSLQDLPAMPQAGYVLQLVSAPDVTGRLGADWLTLLEILEETAMYWKVHGVPFVVFVDEAAELRAWS